MAWYKIAALVTLMVGVLVDNSESCSCAVPQLQNNFCHADFVMLVRLRGEGQFTYKKTLVNRGENDVIQHRNAIDLKYNVKILKIYKVNENDAGLMKNSTVAVVHSPPNDGMCKVDLEQRTKYLIMGNIEDGRLSINLCTWGTPWAWVTKIQKKYLRYVYAKNCECKPMMETYAYNNDNKNNICHWDISDRDAQCYKRLSACILDKNSSTGGCKWHRNPHLKKCRKEKRLQGLQKHPALP